MDCWGMEGKNKGTGAGPVVALSPIPLPLATFPPIIPAMFRLTREVRFAINPDGSLADSPAPNGHAGFPPLLGLGHYFALDITFQGPLDPLSNYLINIKDIDHAARDTA